MQIEYIARICLTSWRPAEQQGHSTVCSCVLSQVIVYAEAVTALALLVLLVHEILSHGNTGIRSQVLQRRRLSSGSSYHDGILHGTCILKSLYYTGYGRSLLTDSHINADTVLALLVQNGIYSNRSLTSTAVTDNQLALAAADWYQGIQCLDTGLQRLMYRLSVCNTRSVELYRTGFRSVDRTLAINRTAQGIYNAANHSLAYWNLHDSAGSLYLGTFLNLGLATENNGTDVILLQVQNQAIYIVTKIQQLTCHSLVQAVDMGDAVTDFDNSANLINIQINSIILDLILDDGSYFFRIHFHTSLSPQFYQLLAINSALRACKRPATLPSMRVSPIFTTMPPMMDLSLWVRSATFLPVTDSSLLLRRAFSSAFRS